MHAAVAVAEREDFVVRLPVLRRKHHAGHGRQGFEAQQGVAPQHGKRPFGQCRGAECGSQAALGGVVAAPHVVGEAAAALEHTAAGQAPAARGTEVVEPAARRREFGVPLFAVVGGRCEVGQVQLVAPQHAHFALPPAGQPLRAVQHGEVRALVGERREVGVEHVGPSGAPQAGAFRHAATQMRGGVGGCGLPRRLQQAAAGA